MLLAYVIWIPIFMAQSSFLRSQEILENRNLSKLKRIELFSFVQVCFCFQIHELHIFLSIYLISLTNTVNYKHELQTYTKKDTTQRTHKYFFCKPRHSLDDNAVLISWQTRLNSDILVNSLYSTGNAYFLTK